MKAKRNFLKDNRYLLIAILGIILIPTIYVNLFLSSMWNPYERTQHLPIVIVNEDEGTDYMGMPIAIGQELVDSLLSNDTLNVVIQDESVASQGLMDGDYYLEIVIPKDFSSNATTVFSPMPKKMQLNYYVNPGYNFIASKFSESIFQRIQHSVDQEVRQWYAIELSTVIKQSLESLGAGGEEGAMALAGTKSMLDAMTEETLDMFTNPVTSVETKVTEVKSNGYAMAPYMMGVGLWIAGLSLLTIYPLKKEKDKSLLMHWVKKFGGIVMITLIMSLILLVTTRYTLGFEPASFGKTLFAACLTSITFMSIMAVIQESVGKTVASYFILIFLIIQLACSTGTYPVELSPEFVNGWKDYMPLYYAVNLFRRTIIGFGSTSPYITPLLGITVVANLLLLGVGKVKMTKG